MTTRAACVLLAMLAFASLSGCSTRSRQGGDRGPADEQINWDNPIGGQRVESVAAAKNSVAFPVIPPTVLGDAAAIYVVPASQDDKGAVDFVYDLSMGRIVVAEFPYDYPAAHWDEFVASIIDVSKRAEATASPPMGPSGEEEVILGSAEKYILPDGRTALITTSEDGATSDIRWLAASGVEIVIQGPDLSKESVIDLASRLSEEM